MTNFSFHDCSSTSQISTEFAISLLILFAFSVLYYCPFRPCCTFFFKTVKTTAVLQVIQIVYKWWSKPDRARDLYICYISGLMHFIFFLVSWLGRIILHITAYTSASFRARPIIEVTSAMPVSDTAHCQCWLAVNKWWIWVNPGSHYRPNCLFSPWTEHDITELQHKQLTQERDECRSTRAPCHTMKGAIEILQKL